MENKKTEPNKQDIRESIVETLGSLLSKQTSSLKKLYLWLHYLPGTKRDYTLIFFAIIDLFLILIRTSYSEFLPESVHRAIITFDFLIITIWGLDFIFRVYRRSDKLQYIKSNWFIIIGVLPFHIFRTLLLLRALRMWIAMYKLSGTDKDITNIITSELTFKFRDVIVDSIADAVFLRALQRVDDVMTKLDYVKLLHKINEKHKAELDKVTNKSLENSTLLRDMKKIPFMQGIAEQLGNDVSAIIREVIESEVAAKMVKEMNHEVIVKMQDKVRSLDKEKLTKEHISIDDIPAQKLEDYNKTRQYEAI